MFNSQSHFAPRAMRFAVSAAVATVTLAAGVGTTALAANPSTSSAPASATMSSFAAPWGTSAPVGGSVNLVVTLRDASGNPVAGKTVNLVSTAPYVKGVKTHLNLGTGVTASDGTVRVAAQSTVAQSVTVAAIDSTDVVKIAQQQTLTFN
jgi:hypothetical protein